MAEGSWIDPVQLEVIVFDAIGQQSLAVQPELRHAVGSSDVEVWAPTSGEWVTVVVAGCELARVHRRRLMRRDASN